MVQVFEWMFVQEADIRLFTNIKKKEKNEKVF